jgi:hypothetical protein
VILCLQRSDRGACSPAGHKLILLIGGEIVVNISRLPRLFVKRTVTILFISFFLQGSIAHALMECFKGAHNVREQEHKQEIGRDAHHSHTEQGAPAVSIHCVESQLQLGLTVPSSKQTLSKRSVRDFAPLWAGLVSRVAANTAAASAIISRVDPSPPYPHALVYLVLSVLRI